MNSDQALKVCPGLKLVHVHTRSLERIEDVLDDEANEDTSEVCIVFCNKQVAPFIACDYKFCICLMMFSHYHERTLCLFVNPNCRLYILTIYIILCLAVGIRCSMYLRLKAS